MSLRLAVGGLLHEANTFSTDLATLDRYRRFGWHSGAEMLARYADSDSVVAGYLTADPATAGDVEIVPLTVAMVTPCGPVAADAFAAITDTLAAELATAGDLDGVLLVLHGAAVAEGEDDADAALARRVRSVVGAAVPIATALDMHANVSPGLVAAVDVITAYQTNPHVDAAVAGARARRLLQRAIAAGRVPATTLRQLPLAVGIVQQDTSTEPMASILDVAARIARAHGVDDLCVLEGFPYADVAWMGMSVVATSWDSAAGAAAADELAGAIWERRDELVRDGTSIAAAVARLRAHSGPAPLLALDVGDNVGGGGPGDSTVLFAAAMAEGGGRCATTLRDPAAVAELGRRAVGEHVEVVVGARSATAVGAPLTISAVITGRHRGPFEDANATHGGFRVFDGGEMVGLRCAAGDALVVTTESLQPISPQQYRVVGIEPTELRAILAKGVNGPRAGFAAICDDIVEVDTPGITRNSLHGLTYTRRRRPMFPYEPAAVFP